MRAPPRPPRGRPFAPIGGVDFPDTILASHLFATGSTGVGKTEALMRLLEAALVPYFRTLHLDTKQTELSVLRSILPKQRIANLHPFDDDGLAWDIAADLDSPQAISDFVYSLIPENDAGGNARFFDSSSRSISDAQLDVFRFLTRSACERLLALGRSWDLRDLICSVSRENLRPLLEQTDRGRRVIRNQLDNSGTSVDREQDLIASLGSHLDRFIPIAGALHHHNRKGRRFSINAWVAGLTPEICLRLALDDQYEHSLHPLVGLMLRYIIRRLFGRRVDLYRPEFFLFFDEVQALAKHVADLPHFMATARTKGCAVIATTQNFVTLRRSSGDPEAHQAFLDNAGVQVFFRTDSREVAEAASRLCGQQEYLRMQPSLGDNEGEGLAITQGDTFTKTSTRGFIDHHNWPDTFEGSIASSWQNSHTPSRQRGRQSGIVITRQTQDLLPAHVFLNLERFSRERGVECFVRIANHKWLARLEPEWIAARSPRRVKIDSYPLDPDATEFHPWTDEEREAFLGTGGASGGGFFDHIGRGSSES